MHCHLRIRREAIRFRIGVDFVPLFFATMLMILRRDDAGNAPAIHTAASELRGR
jgi:hypothetical protein